MYLMDFYFDGESLSDHRAAIGGISGTDENVNLGNVRTINTVDIRDIAHVINDSYDEKIAFEFDIISDPCEDRLYFSDEEIYAIQIWLNNRKGFRKFVPIYDDDSFHDIYINGSFTSVTGIKIGQEIIGFHLVFTGNAPYFFTDKKVKKVLTSENNTIRVFNDSQEIGITPFTHFEIKCKEAGNLILRNDQEPDRKVEVKNCVANEIIVFDGLHEVITSSETHNKLYNDFNYNWPRLIRNEFGETQNVISLDSEGIQATEIIAKYAAVRKVGLIV